MSDSDFVEVVAPAKREEARQGFDRWLARLGLQRSDLDDSDIRIDVMRDLDGGTVYRYLVRRGVFGLHEE